MIEKLHWIESEAQTAYIVNEKALEHKINELVDAVNELQLTVSKMENLEHLKKIGQGFKNLQDPYAEQRKWIGKLCRFWDEDYKDCCVLGILDSIDINRQNSRSKAIYFDSESAGWWERCETVKPDDDIIYKGEEK